MQTFLHSVVQTLASEVKDFSKYTLILPNRRSGVFLKELLKSTLTQTTILPKIVSIESFITELSEINPIDNTTLVFEFYSIYIQLTPKDKTDSFEDFTKWATLLLQDFNEIDRHLIDSKHLFSYLTDIKRIEELLKGEQKTNLINSRLAFFEKFESYYTTLYTHLLNKKLGYQGLQYREAVENIHFYITNTPDTKNIFIGFNALNKAEEYIFKELLQNNRTSIYWDIDKAYLENHNASSFIKHYKKNWNYYDNNSFQWITDTFSKQKNIKIIGTPKNISQLKYTGEILKSIHQSSNNYNDTALVLADESLLSATLNSLPEEVKNVNITMGFDLKNIPLASLFEQVFKLHINSKNASFYYKDILSVLNHPQLKNRTFAKKVHKAISTKNYVYLSKGTLQKFIGNSHNDLSNLLFNPWNNHATIAIENSLKIIAILQDISENNPIEKEYLLRFNAVFQQLLNLNQTFGFIANLKTLHQLYKQILHNEKLSFKGEPLNGLQIMGMLETRVLDFKNLIITSVNEGILPAGKSDHSFIPFDIKKEVGLPTYQEKDAIFSYHFFRLLQRAENIYFVYNTESDSYGSGEQSRFLTQLEILKEDEIEKFVVSPEVKQTQNELKFLKKNESLSQALKELATKGFSPTALTTFILNPFAFYKQKVLKIREIEEVEETIAANTLGTVIHETLHHLYLPYQGVYLTEKTIAEIKTNIAKEIKKWFAIVYHDNAIDSGKNLLIFTIAKQFVTNFLNYELALIKQGKQIKILELEHDLSTTITIDGLDFPVHLKGQADRIDEIDGVLRIIDYKTGKVEQKNLNIKDWALLTSDYKFSKSFQVLFYALLYSKTQHLDLDKIRLESGIISFKNLKSGFLMVNKKEISKDDIMQFTIQLEQLILEIFDIEKPILEKETNFK